MVLAGKVAVVTGSARGIGRATAIALAQAGADVGLNDIVSVEELEGVAAEIRALDRRVILLPADVADQSAVEAMIERTVGELGGLDIAIGNAAYSDREPFYEADMQGFRRTVDVTMWGAFHLMRAAARQMLAQRASGRSGGSIVLISSPHSFIAVPRAMAYNLSKAAVDHMARTAAIELAEHRIRVNVVHPGWIDTPGERKFVTEDQIEKSSRKMPWGRLGRPDEIARGVVFLCDPASDYMTGSTLLIDGGNTLPWWARGGCGVPQ